MLATKILQALGIISGYIYWQCDPVRIEGDRIYFRGPPNSKNEDAARLRELGFTWHEQSETWSIGND